MRGILALFRFIALIAMLRMPLVVEAPTAAILTIEARLTTSTFPKIALGGVVVPVSGDVLVKIAFLVALVVKIGTLFIFILAVHFMKAAGLLALFVVRRLPVAATPFATLDLPVASVISGHVAVSLLAPSLGVVIL
jgi:hypothetical protein